MNNKLTVYRNKQNPNKFLEVMKYECNHYYVVQYIRFGPEESYNGKEVINWNGNTRNRRLRRRWRKSELDVLLQDYEEVVT